MSKKVNYIVSKKFIYENGLEIIFRGGDITSLACEPHSNLPTADKYDKVECIFLLNGVNKKLGEACPGTVGDTFCYTNSGYDGAQIVPYCDDSALDIIKQILAGASNKRKLIKEEDDKQEISNKGDDLNLEKKNKQPKCRACGDYDPFNLVEPDNIVSDGNYTCWACGTHPYRYVIGCKTDEEKEAVRTKYNK